jgi:thiaminase/transcriptional activator TenA
MTFTTKAWSSVAGLLDAIEAHPFVQGLADGTLEPEKFGYYMTQDALYLADYARMLALASSQAPDADEVLFWARSAANAVAVERELHGRFVRDLGAATKSPTCTGYTSYLAALGSAGSYAALVTGLLPCYWIYEHVGNRLLAAAADLADHPYGAWISTYGDPAFAQVARSAREIVDRAAADASTADTARALQAFTTSTRYEWMFWDAAWRLETWPA